MIKYTKINVTILLALSLSASILRGKAKKSVKYPKRIVTIYLTGNVGDMVFGTPVFRALKKNFPKSKLYVIGQSHNEDTLAHNKDIYKYISSPNSIFELWKIVKKINADYAFLLTPSAIELSILYLANISSITVFKGGNKRSYTKAYKILKNLCTQVPFMYGKNVALQNLKLLRPLGIESKDTSKHLYYSEAAKDNIRDFFLENKLTPHKDFIITVAPGAGTKIKQWPIDRFAKLTDYLFMKYKTPIFIVGGPGDKREFSDLKGMISKNTKIVSCLQHSIDELKAFMDNIDLLVANDSAPIYIAEAFNKATVTIVGPTDENEHSSFRKKNRIIKAKDRGVPALGSDREDLFNYNKETAKDQIERISFKDVVEVVDNLISDLHNK